MIRNVFRTINARIGFWLTPLLLLSVLIGAGIAAGYSAANAAPTPSVVSRAMGPRDPAAAANGAAPIRATNPSNGGAAIAPEAAIGAPAPRRNAVDATVVRVGAKTPEGQMYIVKDKSNRQFRILVTPQTVIRREGQRLPTLTLQANDRIVGVGTRQLDGVFRVSSISIMPAQ